MKRFFLLLLFFGSLLAQSSNLLFDGKNYYYADRILVKFSDVSYDNNNKAITSEEINYKIKAYGVRSLEKAFEVADKNISEGKELEKIVVLKYDAPFNPVYLSIKISKLENVEWAEPQYVQQLTFEPNDPQISLQYGLTNIKARTFHLTNKTYLT